MGSFETALFLSFWLANEMEKKYVCGMECEKFFFAKLNSKARERESKVDLTVAWKLIDKPLNSRENCHFSFKA